MMNLLLKIQIYTVGGCMLSEIFLLGLILLVSISSIIVGYSKQEEKHRRHKEWMKQQSKNNKG